MPIGHALHGRVSWNFLFQLWAGAGAVTPYTGVWVEISSRANHRTRSASRPTRACELKSQVLSVYHSGFCSHALHGRVSWNLYKTCIVKSLPVTPYTGVWVEIITDWSIFLQRRSRPTRACELKFAYSGKYFHRCRRKRKTQKNDTQNAKNSKKIGE